ncbi:MAG TPA: peptidase MA family metallohydrolase, partial [Vitreimonas sp.]|nr:peptidase MA family metallohydrolase [Vitreimonas sp.]
MRRLATVVAVLLVLAVVPAARAIEVDWGAPTATAEYGERIVFEQPATLPDGVRRIEVLLETPGGLGPLVSEVPVPARGRLTLRHAIELAEGHILPNTTLTVRWRVTGEDGSRETGPPTTIRYDDTRFDWRTREGDIIRVHWYAGSDAFGDRALEIGERAVQETAELLGVTEDEPVDFFVYADQAEFYEALGPGTRENVGGQANAEIRTLFALIGPGEIDDPWVGVVIPHELVHLVFDTAVDNPYHFPPRWLNEGLAVHLSEGYGPRDRGAVEQAARNGSLIPLEGLTGQFPTTRDRFFLAYAESVSAVDFLIRRHGQEALVQLVRSYATGLTDHEAFEQA